MQDIINIEKCDRLYIPDALYDSDNDLEIPNLRLDIQPRFCEIPFVCYGEQARTYQMNGFGTLHFYTDDYRYNTIYDHPEQILNHNPKNIVEPNFSCFNEMPVAFALQAIYKKRWIARTMQEKGLGVFVDLNVAQKYYKLNLIGVPAGYHSFCTRGYSDRLMNLEFEYEMAKTIAGDNQDKLLFVIYSGGDKVKNFAKEHRCIYVTPLITIKNDYKRAKKKIEQSVAFGNNEIDANKLLNSTMIDMKNNQILNFSKLELQ